MEGQLHESVGKNGIARGDTSDGVSEMHFPWLSPSDNSFSVLTAILTDVGGEEDEDNEDGRKVNRAGRAVKVPELEVKKVTAFQKCTPLGFLCQIIHSVC